MHELSITQSILDVTLSEAEKAQAKQVLIVRVKVGALNGYEPECIEEYFKMLSEGTLAEKAELQIEVVPARICCKNCGHTGEIIRFRMRCPVCQSVHVELISGKEFLIESLDIED